MSRAYVFPGQGAQTIGMGRELADASPAARAVFDDIRATPLAAYDDAIARLKAAGATVEPFGPQAGAAPAMARALTGCWIRPLICSTG